MPIENQTAKYELTMLWKLAISCALLSVSGCLNRAQTDLLEPLPEHGYDFNIFWPPVDPTKKDLWNRQPLLLGNVSIKESSDAGDAFLQLTVLVKRPSEESNRQYWNSQLEFADVPWMDDVRIWDVQKQWQWPNLPFLLQRHGIEREERYGGEDPGKLVDNDFAAVLIRQFDHTGLTETDSTKLMPYVTARWSDPANQKSDIRTVVHAAQSETIQVRLGKNNQASTGILKLWLIYADFLDSRAPATWPREKEWAGGILTYCEIDWEKRPNETCRARVTFKVPPSSTRFAWQEWSEDTNSPAMSKLK